MRKKFKLKLHSGEGIVEVMCTDIDEELKMVRYKDALYDIPTGLWVVRLVHMQKGYGPWENCGRLKDLILTQMMDTVRNNTLFLSKLSAVRKKVSEGNLTPILNPEEVNLFTV